MFRAALVAWLVSGLTAVGVASVRPDVQAIVERSTAAMRADWRAEPDYSYFERDRDSRGTRTYQVTMIAGSPYYRLVAVNGRPLGPAARQRQQQRLQATVARRRTESPSERAERIRRYRRSRARDHLMTEQMTRAFNFSLAGERKMDGHEVYVLQATPRPGYVPPNLEARALTGMQGTLWIDTRTFQWVKVTAEVTRPVSIEGFLARVEPGTFFTLENRPVGPHVWLPTRFLMRSKSLILFFFTHRTQEHDTFYGYRRIEPPGDQAGHGAGR